ncbi:MAG: glycosyltransferase family 4 protein [Rhodospirillales bacterium]
MRPLNFLFVTTFYPPYSFGGDAVYAYRLAHALGDEGHRVDVVHCVDSYHMLHPGPPEIGFPEHPNVTRHELRSGRGTLSPLLAHQTGYPLLKRKILRGLMRKNSYDVVHYHNMSLIGPAALALKPERGRALKLYTAHEHWLVCPMHTLWKYNRGPCEKPACIRCSIVSRRPVQLWRYTGLLQRAATHVDRFLAPSRFAARMHAERGFMRPITHLPGFAERIDAEWQQSGPSPHERPYFLFAGRLEYIKGVQTLIEAWRRPRGYDLLIAGSGSYEPRLRAAAASNPQIRFLGPVPQRGLWPLYRHALACLAPSIAYETFGLVCIEAFACKTPVIARNLGALPEIVEESGGGFVYSIDGELPGLTDQIAASPRLRQELGARGYNSFLRRWTREAHLEAYFNILERAAMEKFGYMPWRNRCGAAHEPPHTLQDPAA